jgi:hypothetical protein
MRTVLRNLVLAAAVAAVGLAAANVSAASIGLNFTGANQRVTNSFYVPDSMGAVGRDHIVEMLNGLYTVYDKATGQQLQRMSFVVASR